MSIEEQKIQATTADQLAQEQSMQEGGDDRARKRRENLRDRAGLSSTDAGASLKDEVLLDVADAIDGFLLEVENRAGGPEAVWYKYVKAVPATQLADVALRGCLDSVAQNITFNTLTRKIGQATQCALFHEQLKALGRSGKRLANNIEAKAQNKYQTTDNRQEYALKLLNDAIGKDIKNLVDATEQQKDVLRLLQDAGQVFEDWTDDLCAHIGCLLISAVLKGSNLFEETSIRPDGGKHEQRFLDLTVTGKAILDQKNSFLDTLAPMFGPTLLPPKKWSIDSLGPYHDPALARLVPIVKHASPEQRKAIKEAMADGSLQECLDALNTLQETPYCVNEYVVDAVQYVYDNDMSDQVSKFPNFIKDEREADERMSKEEFAALDKDAQIELYKERDARKKFNREVTANKLNVGRHLQEARDLMQYNEFYLPHQWDTRGRVYHTSDFGHHNSDYLRAMFLFANKSKLGEEGLLFLHLQLANSWGNKPTPDAKRSLDKEKLDIRLAWVEENWEKIYEVGKDFKNHFAWWTSADKPFEFLAACREYFMFAEYGEEYESGLPIGLDATQSGGQHYAAASLNRQDGVLTNLTANEEPRDLYEAVMHVANHLIDMDIKQYEAVLSGGQDLDEDEETMVRRNLDVAKRIKKVKLTRKACKRPSMTYFYSSRRFGFSQQLMSDWIGDITKDMRIEQQKTGEVKEHPLGKDGGFYCSVYLGGVLQAAIEQVVSSAAEGQAFFKECAKMLAAENKHVTFVTPMGFPMHQNYREQGKTKRQKVWLYDRETKLVDKTKRISLASFNDNVASRKSEQAISPNIIHSMDATLLMKAVNLCAELGVKDLMTVHDSFSTTIGNAGLMSRAIRSAFVDLYSDYCLYSELLAQTKERLDDKSAADALQVPEKGDLDLQEVLKSDYCFS